MGRRTENEVAPVVVHRDSGHESASPELPGELIDLWPHQEDQMIDRAFEAMRRSKRRRHLRLVEDGRATAVSLKRQLREREHE